MGHTINYRLHFEEKDGVFSAPLSFEAWEAIIYATGCLPWSKDGKRGLLYCNMKTYEQAERELLHAAKENPLFCRIVGKMAHWLDIDPSGLLRIPGAAARFAGIRGDAVLSQISEGYLLLTAEEPQKKQRTKGEKRIQIDFQKAREK